MLYHEGRERGAEQTGKSGMSLDVKLNPDNFVGVRQHGGSSRQMEQHVQSRGEVTENGLFQRVAEAYSVGEG